MKKYIATKIKEALTKISATNGYLKNFTEEIDSEGISHRSTLSVVGDLNEMQWDYEQIEEILEKI